jgi:PAS domain S-box-containing protein
MSPVNVLLWLSHNQDEILSRWQQAILEQDIPVFHSLEPDVLSQQLVPFYKAVVNAAERQTAVGKDDLAVWTQYHQERQVSLPDLLKVAFSLRTVVGNVLQESSDAWHAIGAWQTLFPYFDQATTILSEIYTEAVERTLTERLQEAESLTANLVTATEDADRAFVQLRSMFEVSEVLASSLDMDQILTTLVEKLGEALQAHHCAFWMGTIGSLNVIAAYQQQETMFTTISIDEQESSLGSVFESDQAKMVVLSQDVGVVDRELMQNLGIEVLLVVPLTVETITIGLLTIGRSKKSERFDSTEMTLVESLLRQAGIAIQNAGLYDEIRALNNSLEVRIAARTRELAREKERLATLYAIGSELSASLDLNYVLERTLQLITQAVDAKYGSVMLFDHERNTLIYRARLGGQGALPSEGEITPFKPGVGIAGWVFEHREPILIDDVEKDERWLDTGGTAQTRSLIGVPLMIKDEAYGVILISSKEIKAFDASKLRLVIAAAQQVVQAIHNAQLYKSVNESASRNQAILQSIADGVIVNDPKEQVIVFNAAAEKILNTTQEAVLNRDVRRLFDAFENGGRSSALAAMEMISTASDIKAGHAVETTLEAEGQVISAHVAPVITESGQSLGVVTALRDITREVEADRAKTEFVSTVSHELRTPLTSIKGYTDLLHAGAVGPINDAQERFLGIIKTNADRLTALINDLLDISRIETGRIQLNMETVDMVGVIHEVLDLLQGEIEGKGLELRLDLPEQAPTVLGDRARLVQIVTNIVSNSQKYTDEGWIHITLASLEGALRLDVVDSGIGISPEDMAKIFERFYRADTPVVEGRGGTGLGLSITRDLTELHGGRIWVQSELGVGSTFTVLLPIADRKLPPSLLDQLPAGAQKILVVDDERDIVALLRHQLEAKGYKVVIASTGEQAIAKAISEQPSLITLDILLPDRNGFDVLRELKTRPETSHIPVIVLSVVQDENSGYKLGAAGYITKPVDKELLVSSVSHILGQRGKVLVAEDDKDTADMLVDLLESHHLQTFHAVDGYETLTIARRERPGLILLDLRMPGMDGYEALTRLKKDPETRKIPILVMSAHAGDTIEERIKLQKMGAYDFFSKPFDVDELMAEIAQMNSDSQELDNDTPSDTKPETE